MIYLFTLLAIVMILFLFVNSSSAKSLGNWINIGKEFIKKEEGLRLKAYADGAGYSIGYGHYLGNSTSHSERVMTISEVEKLFDKDIADRVLIVQNLPYYSDLTDNMKASLLSYLYNRGSGFFHKKFGVLQKIPNNYEELKELFVTSNPEILLKRRHRELLLFTS